MSTLFEMALRDKKRSHDKAAQLSWEEKIASVERMQEAAYVIRKSVIGAARDQICEKSTSNGSVSDTFFRRD